MQMFLSKCVSPLIALSLMISLTGCYEIEKIINKGTVKGVSLCIDHNTSSLLSEELVKTIADQTKIKEEFGDMMFVYANLARHLKIDPEEALRAANNKFINRFNKIEEIIDNKEKKISSYSLDELEKLWNEVKKEEGNINENE